jgi:hypothetical protein
LFTFLTKLPNVKADRETGMVSSFIQGKWCLLCHNFFHKYKVAATNDYDYCEIRHHIKNEYNCRYCNENRCSTVMGHRIFPVDTTKYLSVFDHSTKKYIPLGPKTCKIDEVYFDRDFNRISDSTITECVFSIQSFQHAHIINESFVLIERRTVEILNNKLIIGGQEEYTMYYNSWHYDTYLENNIKRIYLKSIYNYSPMVDYETNTHNGFIIPDKEKYNSSIFDFDGVWIGKDPNEGYVLLNPYKPDSGKRTKPATNYE